jgi:hypothetical protein
MILKRYCFFKREDRLLSDPFWNNEMEAMPYSYASFAE